MTTLPGRAAAPTRTPAGETAHGNPPRTAPSSFNLTYLRLELRRLVRNRRTVIFSLVLPPVFFLIFGMAGDYRTQTAGDGNVTAWILVSMALYGALLTATAGGASVSVERSQGWTRQLRLTPLRPSAYVATKLAAAMALGAVSVAVTMAVGLVTGGASMPFHAWVGCALIAWAGSVVFAAFGLFMGYLLPSENVMQILGPVLALLSFAGGLFVPLGDGWFADVAKAVPTYGLAELTRVPLGVGASWWAVVNVVAWAVVFSLGAAWRFRKDTARS